MSFEQRSNMISLCFNELAVAAMRTDLEMRGTGGSEETS